jgi:hypothetical protein
MCDKLRGRATNELSLAKSSRLSYIKRRSKKRAREGGYIDSRTLRAQKARLYIIDINIINKLGF